MHWIKRHLYEWFKQYKDIDWAEKIKVEMNFSGSEEKKRLVPVFTYR